MGLRGVFAALAAVAVGATSQRVVRAALGNDQSALGNDQVPVGDAADITSASPEFWNRSNFRGATVSLAAGPALAAGLTDAALTSALLRGNPRAALAASIAIVGAGAAGLNDDLREDTSTRTKGLRGHLGALREGRVTTGALKIAGIGASALVAAVLIDGARPTNGARTTSGARPTTSGGLADQVRPRRRAGIRVWDIAVDTALIAGSANLFNLLDLRPGRALKAGAIAAAGLTVLGARGSAVALAGPIASALPGDLAERDMLGDGGANALGAALGTAATGTPRGVRIAAMAAIVGLTLASERVSFSAVIAKTAWLAKIDAWGRRP